MNGKKFVNKKWVKSSHMRAMAYTSNQRRYGYNWGNFRAILSDGSRVSCAKGNIDVRIPRALTGKIAGNAGNGRRAQWLMGPNKAAYSGAKYLKAMPGLGHCHNRYQYHIKHSPYNGNHKNQPIVKFFKSWQVDGKHVESVFYYHGNHGPGSFNRIAGQKVKPVKGGMSKRPKGARQKAEHKCRALKKKKKAFDKCIFDVLVMGKKAAKESVRDRQAKRMFKKRKPPTLINVRDVSQWANNGVWQGTPKWMCAADFLAAQKVGDEAMTEVER
jgi:hypothetical protein